MIVDVPEGVHEYVQTPRIVTAVQWPEAWSKQAAIVKYLGMSGIVLQFANGHSEPGPRQYIPQLYLFTHRYDRFNVRIGDWIVLTDNERFAVIPKDEFSEGFLPSEVIE